MPSIKALDGSDRVSYVGSPSKLLAAGLRVGYLVAPPAFIAQARAVRRLMLPHPPANSQRAVALFLSLGHHDALVRRLVAKYRERARVLCQAVERHLPGFSFQPPLGGSAVWLAAPERLDMREVARRAPVAGCAVRCGRRVLCQRQAAVELVAARLLLDRG